jgi:cell division protein FtsZ
MPDSILDKALIQSTPGIPNEPKTPSRSIDDDELEKIAAQLQVSIKIVGCGGGGCNTINRCVEAGIMGAQKCAINTDAKHLLTVKADKKILIGRNATRGLGAGAKPEIGEAAARENEQDIRNFISQSNVLFVTAGMGGGTGTGSAHYVAKLGKEAGALTIGVVTLPFRAEGNVRMDAALDGLEKIRRICDTTIVISNDKLLELVPRLPIEKAFRVADEVLMEAIKGITEIVTKPGLVNLDFADIRTVMKEGGVALIGLGESDTPSSERIDEAVNEALNSPLLGEMDLTAAKGAMIRVVGGPDMTVTEAQRAAELVGKRINKMAHLIWGCSIENDQKSSIKALVVITGVKYQQLVGVVTGAPSAKPSSLSGGYRKESMAVPPSAFRPAAPAPPKPAPPPQKPKSIARDEDSADIDMVS